MRHLASFFSSLAFLSCVSAPKPDIRVAQLDSVKAVQLGVEALRAVGAITDSLMVAEFVRDSIGVLITLRPSNPRTVGGGGQVRVSSTGATKVLYLGQ
jgi:hypothetical protein